MLARTNMGFTALSCPQCGGSLPGQARWRLVVCPYCRSSVTRNAELVQAAAFRDALLRRRSQAQGVAPAVALGDRRFRVLGRLGGGESADVYLADELGCAAQLVAVKVAREATGSTLKSEWHVLQSLQAIETAGSAYFSQRLPQPVSIGSMVDQDGSRRQALVVRCAHGSWGSLADVMTLNPAGVDARHAVWMWRRVLQLLAFVHGNGWAHGALSPDHLLVEPREHGIQIIGWSRAARSTPDSLALDLAHSAWSIRAVLTGGDPTSGIGAQVPAQIGALLRRVSEDTRWCRSQDASTLDAALLQAAQAAFGPPRFMNFDPAPDQRSH